MKKILIINSGSSSLKYCVYDLNQNKICSGLCERIFIDGKFKFKDHISNDEEEYDQEFKDHPQAIDYLIEVLKKKNIINNEKDILGIGHRVVQGGTYFKNSIVIDKKVEERIEFLCKLAPLHNRPAINVIRMIKQKFPSITNVATFDTSFHTTMPEESITYAVPKEWKEKYGVQRYGAHGISYRYIIKKFNEIENRQKSNIIVCHLGNGASMCAIKNNKSLHTTMGLTPLAGLIMGTRSGDIDPSIHKYISESANISIQEVDDILHKKSGLIGLSGSSDFRDLTVKYKNGDPDAILTFNLFTQSIVDSIVKYINLLEAKVDAIVFTAGIGENTGMLIEKIFEKIFIEKYKINSDSNYQSYEDYCLISNIGTPKVFKIRTDEELMIAQDVQSLIK